MAGFKETFPNSHTVLPVIHVQDTEHAIRNAGIAREAGADGVFLISMEGMPYWDLAKIKDQVKEEFSDWWVGVNYLDLRIGSTFEVVEVNTDGVWNDDAKINVQSEGQLIADKVEEIRREAEARGGFKGLYFGGVAFKYIKPEVAREDLGLAAKLATRYMDVVTTSGDKTGSAPDVEKIQIMKAAIGEHPLGIASGISPDNVHQFKDADAFLVATSILVPNTDEFDPARVKALVEAVRG